MKKILNDPGNYVEEMLDGLCLAHPGHLRGDPASSRVLVRASAPRRPQVGIVSGGGAGHMPLFHGYLGEGLLSACAIGNVFAGPRVDDCSIAMRAADTGMGVLQLYGNYGGDRMNFDMAREMAELDGMRVSTVRIADDVASASSAEQYKRRGVAGLVFAYKIAGAKAAAGGTLDEVCHIAEAVAENLRSIGIALTPCVVPESGRASFEIEDSEIEFGMGIHGESGIWRGPLQSADALTEQMLHMILAELPVRKGSRVSVLVNSLGATPLEELYILYRKVSQILTARGVTIVAPLVGRYATSMEMGGASLSLILLTPELEQLLLAPADCAFWRVE